MKKFIPALILLSAAPTFAASSWFGALQEYESSSPSSEKNPKQISGPKKTQETTVSSGDTDTTCSEELSSMSLSYLSGILGPIQVSSDSDSEELIIRSSKPMSNCLSMIDWKLRSIKEKDVNSYAVEVKFKSNSDCDEKLGCMYKVVKVVDGARKFEDVRFQPTLAGFESCMEYTGVFVADGKEKKLNSKAIYSTPFIQRFSNVSEDGSVSFVSKGARNVDDNKAKYGDYTAINRCDFFENIQPDGLNVKSAATIARENQEASEKALLDQANKILVCGQYTVIDDFVKNNSDLLASMDGINQKLIEASNKALVEEAKKAIADLAEGKSSESDRAKDIQTIQDFNDKIINQLTNLIVMNSAALEKETDPQMQARLKDRINQDKAALAAYTKDPYVSQGIVKKMLDTGRFDDAKMLFGIQVTAATFSNYGKKIDNVVINSDVAMKRIAASQKQFEKGADDLQEKWAITHGEVTGKAQSEANRFKSIMMLRQTLATNYQNEILREMARTQQPNGYCFQGWRNTNSCIQDSMLRIEQLKQEYQQKDAPLVKAAEESKAKAEEYAKLEGEGKKYIAAQNGEEAPKEDSQIDLTVPTPRADMTPSQALGVPQNGPFAQAQLYNQFQQPGNQVQQPNGQFIPMSAVQYPPGTQYMPYNQFGANVNLQYGYGVNQQNFVNQGMPNFYQPQQVPYAYTLGAYPAMAYGQYNLYR